MKVLWGSAKLADDMRPLTRPQPCRTGAHRLSFLLPKSIEFSYLSVCMQHAIFSSCFYAFLFIMCFQYLITVCLGLVFFLFILPRVSWEPQICGLIVVQIWKYSHSLLQIFLHTPFFWDSNYQYITLLDVVTQVPEALFIYFPTFTFFSMFLFREFLLLCFQVNQSFLLYILIC